MEIVLEDSVPLVKKVLVVLVFISILAGSFGLGLLVKSEAEAETIADAESVSNLGLAVIQGNSLLAVSNPALPVKIRKVRMVVTAYSSDPRQTDSTPFITASGSKVKDGIVANNLLPFGTRIKIPEIYGNKVFVVEDRMNWRKSHYQLDIWFPDYRQAKNFGAKRVVVEILES
jgi:3D (Asp-Asp-Asp) domain-containing protein